MPHSRAFGREMRKPAPTRHSGVPCPKAGVASDIRVLIRVVALRPRVGSMSFSAKGLNWDSRLRLDGMAVMRSCNASEVEAARRQLQALVRRLPCGCVGVEFVDDKAPRDVTAVVIGTEPHHVESDHLPGAKLLGEEFGDLLLDWKPQLKVPFMDEKLTLEGLDLGSIQTSGTQPVSNDLCAQGVDRP